MRSSQDSTFRLLTAAQMAGKSSSLPYHLISPRASCRVYGHIFLPAALLICTRKDLDLRSLEPPIRQLIEQWSKYAIASSCDGTNRPDRTNALIVEMSLD